MSHGVTKKNEKQIGIKKAGQCPAFHCAYFWITAWYQQLYRDHDSLYHSYYFTI